MPFGFITTEDLLLVCHVGPTDIENGEDPPDYPEYPEYGYADYPEFVETSSMIGVAEIFDGGYWVLTSVFC
jgi:hypothetical protein